MKKAFNLFNVGKKECYLVTDSTDVAKILDVDPSTIWRLFKSGAPYIEYKGWIIFKEYDIIKSSRGKG